MTKIALACDSSLGGSDDAPLKELLTKVLGRAETHVEESCLPRPFNESYATVAADIRVQTAQSNEDLLRKLTPADRAARLEELQKRLTGTDIRGPHEPGDTVVDKFGSLCESDRLRRIRWDQCISRGHELTSNKKKDQRLAVQSSGELKISSASRVGPCDTSSEILLRYCFIRRALAMEQAYILAYHHHDRWLGKIMSCRLETVPPGFSGTTFKQIEAVDKSCSSYWLRGHAVALRRVIMGGCAINTLRHACTARSLSLLQPNPIAVRPVHVPYFRIVEFGLQQTPQGSRLCISFNLKKCSNSVQNQRREKGQCRCLKQHAALHCPMRRKD